MAYRQVGRSAYDQPCDSFFIEAEDEGVFAAKRRDHAERARLLNKERQRALEDVMFRQTSDEYFGDVINHMFHMEGETMPDVASIDIQTEVKWYMRPYLIDFLIEAHAAFQLLPETLYLAVNLLDRYCSRRVVYKRHYQLVGCAALLIASKYGDRKDRVPTVRELRSMCCQLYEEEMFTQMEWHVLQTLSWAIGHPTVDSFLQAALYGMPQDPEVEHMTWYFCELALFHREFVSVLPSVIARAALALSRGLLARDNPSQADWAGAYDMNVVTALSEKIYSPSTVVYKKYNTSHLSCVSSKASILLERLRIQTTSHQAPPPTPPADITARNVCEDAGGVPHTPQKAQYGPNMINGYMTPPITPETPSSNVDVYRHDVRACPSTPSPATSAPYITVQHYSYGHDQMEIASAQAYV